MFEAAVPRPYRGPIIGRLDRALRKSLFVSSGLGLLVLLVVLLAPSRRSAVVNVEEVPRRFAKLLIEPPRAQAPAKAPSVHAPQPPAVEEPDPAPEPNAAVEPVDPPVPEPKPGARRAEAAEKPTGGDEGRDRAVKDVTQNLAGAASSVTSVLEGLSSSLAATNGDSPRSPKAPRRVRGARPAADLEVPEGGAVAAAAGADLEGSSLAASSIRIEGVESLRPPEGKRTEGGAAGSTSPYRTDASLLAVVRRYAAGIQYCYENELKREPGLRGKLTVSISVAASGNVLEAGIVADDVRCAALNACVLSQIREWRFPAVDGGDVVFRTPFVFRPPEP